MIDWGDVEDVAGRIACVGNGGLGSQRGAQQR